MINLFLTLCMFTGVIFWIGIICGLIYMYISSFKQNIADKKTKYNEKIEYEARRDIGRSIFSSAYWYSGDEYKDVHPYELMKLMGADIRDTGWLHIEQIRKETTHQKEKTNERKEKIVT